MGVSFWGPNDWFCLIRRPSNAPRVALGFQFSRRQWRIYVLSNLPNSIFFMILVQKAPILKKRQVCVMLVDDKCKVSVLLIIVETLCEEPVEQRYG